MAPVVGTGLGLTESAGFCTYVSVDVSEREKIFDGLGHDMPVYACTIRQPMRDDGQAGEALPDGEIGHICFLGPQTFAGYVNDPEATARTISRDGYLYTGDLGYRTAAGIHLSGRAKWVIKSFGYQVFPGDVEAHIGEGVVALVEKRPGVDLAVQELERHTRSLASYMRPRHWIIVEPGQMPLNRLGKPDHQRAQEMANQAIAKLRASGEWDSMHTNGGSM